MSLPQITDVVVHAAAFVPARYRPDVAGQHQEANEAAGNLQMMHRLIPARGNKIRCRQIQSGSQGPGAKFLSSSPTIKSYRQVTIGARPSSTSDIRSRVPWVVSAGSAAASKNPQAIISWFGSGRRSCLKCLTR